MTPSAPPAAVPVIVPTLLIAASAVSILSTDMYAPSLPHLASIFATDAATVQLTMTLNVAGFALAQLVLGPLSDARGRRPVMLAGMAAFAILTLACGFAWSIGALIGARAAQGVVASVEAVIALAIIRDLYDEAAAVRLLAIYGMAIAAAPALGPVIGGHVHVLLGWRANFYILAALIAAVAFLMWRRLPETLPAEARLPLHPRTLLRHYLALAASRRFIGYAVPSGLVLGGLFAFVTAGPFVLIEHLGVATEAFGYYQAVIVAGYVAGAILTHRIVGRASVEGLLRAGLALMAAGGAATVIAALAWESPATLTAAMTLFAFGMGPFFSAAPARALAEGGPRAGVASALIGSIEMLGAAAGSLAVGLLYDGTAGPLAWTVAASAVLAGAVYAAARPWR